MANPSKETLLEEIGKPRPTGVKKALRIGLIALAVLAVAAGLVFWRIQATATKPVQYLTTAVTRGDLAATVTATGTLRGKETVSVGAETNGRVLAVRADFNSEVKKGQVLAELDPSQIAAALSQAKAQLQAARAEVRNRVASAVEARLAVERARDMAVDGLVSKQQVEAAVAAIGRADAATASAQAQVAVAQASVESNQTALGKTQIRSPLDGVVLSRNVEVGQTLAVSMTTPVLFQIARDLREMEVTIAIDEADVGRTHEKQKATFTVDAWPDKKFPGVLFAIHNVAVTKDNVVTYEGLLRVSNNESLLRPGMTATVTVETDGSKDVLMVPNAALRFSPPAAAKPGMFPPPPGGHGSEPVSDGKSRLWRLKDTQLTALVVETGLTDGVQTEIKPAAGEVEVLAEGDTIVTDISQGAKP